MPGSIITILIWGLVIAYLAQKSISLVEMSHPTIQSYRRSIYRDEQEAYGAINLNDSGFNFGLFFEGKDFQHRQIPESIGRFMTQIKEFGKGASKENVLVPTVPCSNVFIDQNQENSAKTEKAIASGLCADTSTSAV